MQGQPEIASADGGCLARTPEEAREADYLGTVTSLQERLRHLQGKVLDLSAAEHAEACLEHAPPSAPAASAQRLAEEPEPRMIARSGSEQALLAMYRERRRKLELSLGAPRGAPGDAVPSPPQGPPWRRPGDAQWPCQDASAGSRSEALSAPSPPAAATAAPSARTCRARTPELEGGLRGAPGGGLRSPGRPRPELPSALLQEPAPAGPSGLALQAEHHALFSAQLRDHSPLPAAPAPQSAEDTADSSDDSSDDGEGLGGIFGFVFRRAGSRRSSEGDSGQSDSSDE